MKSRVNVFYSWQSDLPKETNNNFIRSCLESVTDRVERSGSDFELYIDEATRDESGSIHIPLTLENKIREADIFICDLSIINLKSTFKRTPNPNVIFELAFAAESIDWSNIVCVVNDSFGDIKFLPFDFSFRHMVIYKLSKDNTANSTYAQAESQKLINKLEKSIVSILKKGISNPKVRMRDYIKFLNNSEWVAVDPKEHNEGKPSKQGDVTISHEHDNIFSLNFQAYNMGIRHHQGDWKARIFIDRDAMGTGKLSFESNVDFGLKDAIIEKDRIMLIGSTVYGNEMLIRAEKFSPSGEPPYSVY